MSKFREFITDNPVVVGTGVIIALMAFMDFEKPSDINAVKRTPASKSKTSGKKYFDILDDEYDSVVEEGGEEVNESSATVGNSALALRPIDDNPADPLDNYDQGIAAQTYSSSDEPQAEDNSGPQILTDVEEEAEPQVASAPGPDCTQTPNAPECLAGTLGGGAGAPPAVAACDPNNPASECYVEPDTCTPGLQINPIQGSYVKNPTLSLNPTHSCVTSMHYCIQKDGGCCDPLAANNYTESFLVSTQTLGTQDNGTFCVSVIAKGDNGDLSPLYEYQYKVDDTAPDMVATFSPVVRIQSSEAFDYVQIDSQNFGQPGFSAFLINSFADDPLTLGKTCDEVVADYPPITNALRSPAGNIVTPLEPLVWGVDSVQIYKFFENTMAFEDNFLTAFVTFTDPIGDQLHTCQQAPAPVQVFDFSTFVSSPMVTDTIAPNIDGVIEFQGSFTNFGHFNGVSESGDGRSNAAGTADCGTGPGNCYLETGFINIVN